jgi:hypothetical protein
MGKWNSRLVSLLFVSGAFVYAFPSATLWNVLVGLLHWAGGALVVALLVWQVRQLLAGPLAARLGWILLLAGGALGLALIWTGTARPLQPLLYAHIVVSLGGVILLGAHAMAARGWLASAAQRFAALTVAVAIMGGGAWWLREVGWQRAYRIENPPMPPASMDAKATA